jgi:hypothetical protein
VSAPIVDFKNSGIQEIKNKEASHNTQVAGFKERLLGIVSKTRLEIYFHHILSYLRS